MSFSWYDSHSLRLLGANFSRDASPRHSWHVLAFLHIQHPLNLRYCWAHLDDKVIRMASSSRHYQQRNRPGNACFWYLLEFNHHEFEYYITPFKATQFYHVSANERSKLHLPSKTCSDWIHECASYQVYPRERQACPSAPLMTLEYR